MDRYQLEALSENGHLDVAYALLTQKTYPSLGFEILNPLEPATTWWEEVSRFLDLIALLGSKLAPT